MLISSQLNSNFIQNKIVHRPFSARIEPSDADQIIDEFHVQKFTVDYLPVKNRIFRWENIDINCMWFSAFCTSIFAFQFTSDRDRLPNTILGHNNIVSNDNCVIFNVSAKEKTLNSPILKYYEGK